MSQIAKAILILVFAVSYGVAGQVYIKMMYPMNVNDVALTQMQDSADSFQNLQGYNLALSCYEWGWLSIVVLSILLFLPEIMNRKGEK